MLTLKQFRFLVLLDIVISMYAINSLKLIDGTRFLSVNYATYCELNILIIKSFKSVLLLESVRRPDCVTHTPSLRCTGVIILGRRVSCGMHQAW